MAENQDNDQSGLLNQSNMRVKDIEEAIEKSGGLSKFQCASFSIILMGMFSGAFILYSIPYFTKQPDMLLCQYTLNGDWESCTTAQACPDGDDFKNPIAIDTDFENDKTALHNWVQQMDLYCTGSYDLGFPGSAFLFGCFAGSFILPRLADMVGRKPMMLTGLCIYITTVVILLFCKKLWLADILMFFGGIGETGRYYVAYVYLVEFNPIKYQDAAGLYIFMVFGFIMTLIALQFWFVCPYWQINAGYALFFAVVSLILILVWLPESPRYYYGKKMFDKCRAVMEKVSKMNLNQKITFKFDGEFDNSDKEEKSALNFDNSSFAGKADDNDMIEPQPKTSLKGPSRQELEQAQDEMALKGNLKELFSVSVYRRNLSLMVIVWSFGAFSFFIIPFYIGTTDLNIYAMNTATAVGEIFASLISLFLVHGRDKRYMIALFLVITCVSSVGLMLLLWLYEGTSQVPEAASFLLQYTGVVTVFDLIYVVVPELFPTIFLATSYGCCNVVGRAVAIASPVVARAPNPWPLTVLAVYSLLCIFLTLSLVPLKTKEQPKLKESEETETEEINEINQNSPY